MLGVLTGKWRWRAAGLLVALYAFCLAAPTAVLAFGAATTPAHCLTEASQAPGSSHVHHGEPGQDHPDTGDADHNHASKCCGLFAVTGVMPAIDFVITRLRLMSHIAPIFEANLSGQDSDRIDRPPRSLPSL